MIMILLAGCKRWIPTFNSSPMIMILLAGCRNGFRTFCFLSLFVSVKILHTFHVGNNGNKIISIINLLRKS
jgi:hypothetical protein